MNLCLQMSSVSGCEKATAVFVVSPFATGVTLHTFEFQLAKVHIRDFINYLKIASGPENWLISFSDKRIYKRKKNNFTIYKITIHLKQ